MLCDSFCDCQILCLAGSYNPTKIYLGIFWRVIMFGLLHRSIVSLVKKCNRNNEIYLQHLKYVSSLVDICKKKFNRIMRLSSSDNQGNFTLYLWGFVFFLYLEFNNIYISRSHIFVFHSEGGLFISKVFINLISLLHWTKFAVTQ